MKAPACEQCDEATRKVVWRYYASGCADCEVRELAYLCGEELTRELDEIERKDGLTARHRVYARVRAEKARIAALAYAMPRRA